MSTETEILSEVEALKVKVSDTRTLYREVCALLFFTFGITPTANKLYQYVRRGSMNVPTEEVGKFWDDLRHRARVDIERPDLPDPVKAIAAEAIAALWRQATEAARDELAVARLQYEQEAEQARAGRDAAERAVVGMHAAAEQHRADLECARAETDAMREELEAERRAHAGTLATIQQMQRQLEEASRQQQSLQEGFAAEVAKAREAAEAANERAAGAERRALREIEQERQARARADAAVDAARAKLAEVETSGRELAVQHAAKATRLEIDAHQGKLALEAAARARDGFARRVADLEQELASCRQEVSRHQAEAQTLRALVERLTPAHEVGLAARRAGRRKAEPTDS
ncbi:DNA-binding protein [Roseateles sp.]|uniref:DNA-binding protein n=1 Tax=Roseateles sp. TaxID=1971397 RepID=UPI0031D31F62